MINQVSGLTLPAADGLDSVLLWTISDTLGIIAGRIASYMYTLIYLSTGRHLSTRTVIYIYSTVRCARNK